MPSEKYCHAPEILEHCQRIGKQYGLYDGAQFHTQVTDLSWDDGRGVWVVRTNRGDEFTTQFIGMGTGPLHLPKLPGIPGIESFRGHTFHTSRWDYEYTGGDPSGAPTQPDAAGAGPSRRPASRRGSRRRRGRGARRGGGCPCVKSSCRASRGSRRPARLAEGVPPQDVAHHPEPVAGPEEGQAPRRVTRHRGEDRLYRTGGASALRTLRRPLRRRRLRGRGRGRTRSRPCRGRGGART